MIGVLHVIQQLSVGGASRALVAMAAASAASRRSTHRILSLDPPTAGGERLASAAGLAIVPGAATARAAAEEAEIAGADVVQVHFWNTPELYAFIGRVRAPSRVLVWSDVAGDTPPHIFTPMLARWAQAVAVTAARSRTLPALADRGAAWQSDWTRAILGAADLSRVASVSARPHQGFVVTYIGTVDFVKMHPRFMAMSAAVRVQDCRFVVCGPGTAVPALTREATALGAAGRFDFRGYAHDIASVLAVSDVFGYPLAADNYSGSDLVLQEAMYAGVPPVIFRHGGTQALVIDGETGLVVDDEEGYVQAIEYLHREPAERLRLGAAAARYARANFGAGPSAAALDDLYERMMTEAPRAPFWPETGTAAERFTARLGDHGAAFRVSLSGADVDQVLAAEEVIAAAPPTLVDAASGGVLHYRRACPSDPMLRLWAGLVLRHAGRPALAAAEFTAAIRLGQAHWRASWYLAQAAADAGARATSRAALIEVLDAAPDFAPALALRSTMG